MKRPVLLFTLFFVIVAISIFSWWRLAQTPALDVVLTPETTQPSTPSAQRSVTARPSKSRARPVARVNTLSSEQLLKKINEIWQEDLAAGDENCMESLENEFPRQEYLDPKSNYFQSTLKLDIANALVSKFYDVIELGRDYDSLVTDLLNKADSDPDQVHELFIKGEICVNPTIQNFQTALAQALGYLPNSAQKQQVIVSLLENVQRPLQSRMSIQYTFTTMEVLFSLLDAGVIDASHREQLLLIRQDIMDHLMNFEKNFEARTPKDDKRLLYRDHLIFMTDTNENISLLIDQLSDEFSQ